jgi:hypothetical protein
MKLDTGEQKRVAEPVAARPIPESRPRPTPRARRSRRLYVALALVIVAGFLIGLGVPVHL